MSERLPTTVQALVVRGGEPIIGGIGGVYRLDGGTWKDVLRHSDVTDLHMVGDHEIWIAAAAGYVWRWSTDAPEKIDLPELGSERKTVGGMAPDALWVVGHDWAFRWDGSSWRCFTSGCRLPMRSQLGQRYHLAAIDRERFWVAGNRKDDRGMYSAIIHEWDGSNLVDRAAGLPLSHITGLWTRRAGELWAVGDGGVAHWDGSAWTARSLPVPHSPRSIAGAPDGHVFVAAANGRVYRWDGGKWKEQLALGDGAVVSHMHVDGADLWMVADVGKGWHLRRARVGKL